MDPTTRHYDNYPLKAQYGANIAAGGFLSPRKPISIQFGIYFSTEPQTKPYRKHYSVRHRTAATRTFYGIQL